MRKNALFILAFLIACLWLLPTDAAAATEGDYTYTVTNGEATITGCNTSISRDIVIPSTLGGYPVTGIGEYAFFECFFLRSIDIPEGVASIGDYAFGSCIRLTDITIPGSVATIGEHAFYRCLKLTGIWVDENNTNYSCDGVGALFNKDKTTFIHMPSGLNNSYTVPRSVTRISDYAFSGSNLRHIAIQDRVTSIGNYAFHSCVWLTNITIPDSVTSIGEHAFQSCTSLTRIRVNPDNKLYSSDETGALFNKDKSTLLYMPAGYDDTYTIPDGVYSIGDYAFDGCFRIKSITIPDSVTSISELAFRTHGTQRGIWVNPDNPNYSSDDKGALFNKDKTLFIRMPDSISGTYTIPDSVTTICDYAFANCDLTSIIVPDSVTKIGNYTFSFNQCLSGISIPDSVREIGEHAFDTCYRMTRIAIPDSVISIGNDAFYGCEVLQDVYYSGSQADWASIVGEKPNTYIRIHFNTVLLPADCDHTYSPWAMINDTQHGQTCSFCTTENTADHIWDNGQIIKNATYTETGAITYNCTQCRYTKTEIIPKNTIELIINIVVGLLTVTGGTALLLYVKIS